MTITPHAHLLCNYWKSYAVKSPGDTLNLIEIPKYDFHWQGSYTFKKYQKLPANTPIYATARYDNTSNNPSNPSSPPRNVSWGEFTTDEMFLVGYEYVSYEPGDEFLSLENNTINGIQSKYSKFDCLSIYPNPAKDRIKLRFSLKENSIISADIFDNQGKMGAILLPSTTYNDGVQDVLLQLPILFAMFQFFPSAFELRQQSFLWAEDLSTFDNVLNLPFSIPFYGDHVSLFTLTAVITSLLISILGMSNMQDNSNPMMKYMPYIFPVMLLGVFNKLPSALTWYYTISNTITLILQIVIQKYIIDHNKIMVEIAENRKKPVKKSKMQERIEAMQESQKKLQDMKKKG
jgi:YidC/Oxa1 family membrane protein insertase